MSVFVVRERELAELRAGLGAAFEDSGAFILVAGEPGIGKTSLANAFGREAVARPSPPYPLDHPLNSPGGASPTTFITGSEAGDFRSRTAPHPRLPWHRPCHEFSRLFFWDLLAFEEK